MYIRLDSLLHTWFVLMINFRRHVFESSDSSIEVYYARKGLDLTAIEERLKVG